MRHAIALVAVLALALTACGPSPSAPQTSEPGASPSDSAATPPASTAPSTSAPGTPAPPETTPPGEPTPEPTVAPSLEPGASLEPSVDSLKVKRYADCGATNGTSTVGYIKISWTASGTTGVRISIDPPSESEALSYGYADYPASGSAEVPFACDTPNRDANGDYHEYVVTTIPAKGGRFSYRYAKVYMSALAMPAM